MFQMQIGHVTPGIPAPTKPSKPTVWTLDLNPQSLNPHASPIPRTVASAPCTPHPHASHSPVPLATATSLVGEVPSCRLPLVDHGGVAGPSCPGQPLLRAPDGRGCLTPHPQPLTPAP
ncbi:hypothetical protein T484DRAFT_2299433 [Baffinella frigidus]|nr:hypothetical protein T484DRAFT_2299433 [Cryptophyta sp. CCMP2293]